MRPITFGNFKDIGDVIRALREVERATKQVGQTYQIEHTPGEISANDVLDLDPIEVPAVFVLVEISSSEDVRIKIHATAEGRTTDAGRVFGATPDEEARLLYDEKFESATHLTRYPGKVIYAPERSLWLQLENLLSAPSTTTLVLTFLPITY